MSDWQPIETAPRDGTRVLVYRQGYADPQSVAYWSRDWCEWTVPGGSCIYGVTDWQPLPNPPEVSDE